MAGTAPKNALNKQHKTSSSASIAFRFPTQLTRDFDAFGGTIHQRQIIPLKKVVDF